MSRTHQSVSDVVSPGVTILSKNRKRQKLTEVVSEHETIRRRSLVRKVVSSLEVMFRKHENRQRDRWIVDEASQRASGRLSGLAIGAWPDYLR